MTSAFGQTPAAILLQQRRDRLVHIARTMQQDGRNLLDLAPSDLTAITVARRDSGTCLTAITVARRDSTPARREALSWALRFYPRFSVECKAGKRAELIRPIFNDAWSPVAISDQVFKLSSMSSTGPFLPGHLGHLGCHVIEHLTNRQVQCQSQIAHIQAAIRDLWAKDLASANDRRSLREIFKNLL